jgi:protein TonB
MRVASRTLFVATSVGAHVAFAAGLAAIPARAVRETIAITLAETKKAPPGATVDPAPKAPEPPAATTHVARAKLAPPAQAAPAPATNSQASRSLDALPDFGLSLSGTGGGLAVAPASTASPALSAPKVLARTLAPSKTADDCDEPPAKPKLVSQPIPTYTDDARSAGTAGKVRVEIGVDERGRIVSVRILQGLGHGLDEAALAAARSARFEPAVRCGKPSAATIRIGFTFSP